MRDTIKAVVGGSGVIANEVVNNIDPNDVTNGAGLVSQIIILVVTLIGLFRRKKPRE